MQMTGLLLKSWKKANDLPENLEVNEPAMKVRIGNFVSLRKLDRESAMEFAAGYRSGIAKLAKGSYVYPATPVESLSPYTRGFRFAFAAHWFARRHGLEEWPDINLENAYANTRRN